MAQLNTDIDFYPRKFHHCWCLRTFLQKVYNEECLRSINEIFYVFEKEQDIKWKFFMHKKLCQIHLGHYLLQDACACQMVDGSIFQFGDKCVGNFFCYNCLSLALEIMKRYCRYKSFNE